MTVAAQRRPARGAWTTALCGGLVMLLAGCASWLGPSPPPAPTTAEAGSRTEAPAAPVVRVEVQAPGELKALG